MKTRYESTTVSQLKPVCNCSNISSTVPERKQLLAINNTGAINLQRDKQTRSTPIYFGWSHSSVCAKILGGWVVKTRTHCISHRIFPAEVCHGRSVKSHINPLSVKAKPADAQPGIKASIQAAPRGFPRGSDIRLLPETHALETQHSTHPAPSPRAQGIVGWTFPCSQDLHRFSRGILFVLHKLSLSAHRP